MRRRKKERGREREKKKKPLLKEIPKDVLQEENSEPKEWVNEIIKQAC